MNKPAFRVFDHSTNKYLEEFVYKHNKLLDYVLCPSGDLRGIDYFAAEEYDLSFNDYTIQFATDYFDSKGVRIFEGDIVVYTIGGITYRGKIVREKSGWVINSLNDDSSNTIVGVLPESEVVGNIYETIPASSEKQVSNKIGKETIEETLKIIEQDVAITKARLADTEPLLKTHRLMYESLQLNFNTLTEQMKSLQSRYKELKSQLPQ